MTQMLLFDSPAALATAGLETETAAVATLPARRPARHEPLGTPVGEVSGCEPGYDRGVNHMGDLARLVLLRYDLLARRRARRSKNQ